MLGLLILIPTFAFVPHYAFVIPLFYIIAFRKISFDLKTIRVDRIDPNTLLVLFIVLLSISYRVFFADNIKDYFPEAVLLILTLIYSKFLNAKDLIFLIAFITFEAVIVLLEYFIGVQSVIPSIQESINAEKELINQPNLLYYTRPYGISSNSSIVGYKLFIGFVLTFYLGLKSVFWRVAQSLIILAMVFTFNRTVLLITIIFIFLLLFKPLTLFYGNLLKMRIKKIHVKPLLLAILTFLLIVGVGSYYFDSILSQVTRSKGVDLSGREGIWLRFIEFIKANFWFGNGTFKYKVPHHDGLAHAHNSFLQVLASHGFFIFAAYMLLVFRNLTKQNIIYVIAFLFYSTFQYGVFWGVSLMDIIFFMFLLRNDLKPCTRNNTEVAT